MKHINFLFNNKKIFINVNKVKIYEKNHFLFIADFCAISSWM